MNMVIVSCLAVLSVLDGVDFVFVFKGCLFLPILSSLNLLILLDLTIFIYLKNRAVSDGYRSIMYRIADKQV